MDAVEPLAFSHESGRAPGPALLDRSRPRAPRPSEAIAGEDVSTWTAWTPRRALQAADGYTSNCSELDTAMEAVRRHPRGQRKLITNHHVFGYLAERFGFQVIGAVIPSGTTLASPSSSDLRRAHRAIRARRRTRRSSPTPPSPSGSPRCWPPRPGEDSRGPAVHRIPGPGGVRRRHLPGDDARQHRAHHQALA